MLVMAWGLGVRAPLLSSLAPRPDASPPMASPPFSSPHSRHLPCKDCGGLAWWGLLLVDNQEKHSTPAGGHNLSFFFAGGHILSFPPGLVDTWVGLVLTFRTKDSAESGSNWGSTARDGR